MNREDQRELSQQSYWDAQYTRDGLSAHNWFKTFDDIRPFLVARLPAASSAPHILHLGCGTSDLTERLSSLSYTNQTNVDFSPTCIDLMRTATSHLPPTITWQVMDVRALSLPTSSIDAAIDKGTLDAMLFGSLWDPEDEVRANVKLYVDEVLRVLKPGGKWLYITFRQPHFLRPLLVREGWEVEVETLEGSGGGFEYFGWVITKHAEQDA